MPVLRQPIGARRSHLPAHERLPPLTGDALPPAEALHLLSAGELTVEGRLLAASNTTLLASVAGDGRKAMCVYKPVAGERPLWDFPNGTLAARERAAYLVSEATGWAIVPPTVLRDGPLGPGMCQLWVDLDPGRSIVDVLPAEEVPTGWPEVLRAIDAEGQPVSLAHADDPLLRRVALFDAVVNNADRKGGHLLPMPDGSILGIDHGVCFAEDDKLRTVLWGWAGGPLGDEESHVLASLSTQLADDLGSSLSELLSAPELTCTRARVTALLDSGTFPLPGEGWPAIPWPPF